MTTLNCSEVMSESIKHGCKPQLESPHSAGKEAVCNGEFQLNKTLSDILIHLSDMTELQPLKVSCERSSELTIGILIEGTLQFDLDDQTITLEVLPGEKPKVFAYNISSPTRWRRHFIKNNRVKKILFCIPHTWLQCRFRSHSELDAFVQGLLFHQGAESFIHVDADKALDLSSGLFIQKGKNIISEMELECLALTSMINIIQTLKAHANTIMSKYMHNDGRTVNQEALKICQFIEEKILHSNPPVQLKLDSIAKSLRMSTSTAQRAFKSEYQQTIIDYVRTRRLEIARNQLREKLSIGEVAYIAGYTHSANFSLAFKKHFGISPGEIRQ